MFTLYDFEYRFGEKLARIRTHTYTTRALTIEIISVTPSTYTTGASNIQTNPITSPVHYCPHHLSLWPIAETHKHDRSHIIFHWPIKERHSQPQIHDRTHTTSLEFTLYNQTHTTLHADTDDYRHSLNTLHSDTQHSILLHTTQFTLAERNTATRSGRQAHIQLSLHHNKG